MKRSLLVFCSFFALSIFAPAVAQATNQPLVIAKAFELVRKKPEGDAVKGELTGGHNCDTLENNAINKKNNLPYAIPAGEYKVEVTKSERFGRPMPLIKNVPDRDGIRFHQGSKPKHSTGCVLVPDRRDEDAITKLILDDKAKKIESSITIRNHRSPSPAPNDSDDDDSDDEGLDSPVGSGSPRGSSESEQKSGSGWCTIQ